MSNQPTLCPDCNTPMTDAGPIGDYCPNKQCDQPSLKFLFKICYHDPFKKNTLEFLLDGGKVTLKCTVCKKEVIKWEVIK